MVRRWKVTRSYHCLVDTSPAVHFHSSAVTVRKFSNWVHRAVLLLVAAVSSHPKLRNVLESVKEPLSGGSPEHVYTSLILWTYFDCIWKQRFGTLKNNHQIVWVSWNFSGNSLWRLSCIFSQNLVTPPIAFRNNRDLKIILDFVVGWISLNFDFVIYLVFWCFKTGSHVNQLRLELTI